MGGSPSLLRARAIWGPKGAETEAGFASALVRSAHLEGPRRKKEQKAKSRAREVRAVSFHQPWKQKKAQKNGKRPWLGAVYGSMREASYKSGETEGKRFTLAGGSAET